jgi:hypothetical protein
LHSSADFQKRYPGSIISRVWFYQLNKDNQQGAETLRACLGIYSKGIEKLLKKS